MGQRPSMIVSATRCQPDMTRQLLLWYSIILDCESGGHASRAIGRCAQIGGAREADSSIPLCEGVKHQLQSSTSVKNVLCLFYGPSAY